MFAHLLAAGLVPVPLLLWGGEALAVLFAQGHLLPLATHGCLYPPSHPNAQGP